MSEFIYTHQDRGQARTLFLLHGTGGDEHDLIPLVEPVSEGYNIVGLRGNISEGGMPRFFARLAMGVFDQASIEAETDKLAAFLARWYSEHDTDAKSTTFVGYSNGANMILATLLRHPTVITNAALLHSMLPFEPRELDLAGKNFLLTYGLQDVLVPIGEAQRVTAVLQSAGASVQGFAYPGGHELTHAEQATLLEFLS
ncbi:MAG TPA: alpha/beta hydrolase [Anaerolineales bacterium]|nr:alpha/beta hydrolase [Anaerolineales bacterium]HRQ93129.1 alpha/beta hydrolase [Anaerolineales bacterium]